MGKLKNLEDLFHHHLKDVYSAEKQLIKALPKMIKNSSNKDLKKAFEEHLEETKEHKKRLDEIGKELGIEMTGETCEAMKGLIKEAEEFIKENPDLDVKDAGIIADAQRVEHYEISAYGTLVTYAKGVGNKDAAKKLQKTLDEESAADKKLTKLAKKSINPTAKSA
ncbi:ferritin-like domain-containing protein [Rhodohalobacter sp. SW132]|uniref:YciE/YciF ferroxidase family protein n=1 Tax=Rhodohalobacter sp. SW132 TaxID=2293433 RepID=UPI000E285003|nr:ferritin-like domain-containing protein [Rhodohalobacter sp. SW132]REL32937.1 ferritin-like domain-containing protein [Rhodohalobacter sp. SW132]